MGYRSLAALTYQSIFLPHRFNHCWPVRVPKHRTAQCGPAYRRSVSPSNIDILNYHWLCADPQPASASDHVSWEGSDDWRYCTESSPIATDRWDDTESLEVEPE